MKWNNHKTYHSHYTNIRVHRDRKINDISMYYTWVVDIARGFNLDYAATGILTFNDLIQAGNEGLVRAWNRLDWDAIQATPEPERAPMIWSFLKIRIKGQIREEIDRCGAFIKVPQRVLKEARASMTPATRVFANLFPKFFDTDFPELVEEITMWDNELLYEFLMDILHTHVLNDAHRAIIIMSFGIDTLDDKPVSAKKIGKLFSLSEANIWKIKSRTIKLLSENEEIQEKIENYLQN